ncbi:MULTISPECIES: cobyrinate a,c-diamide synthase [unclassified Ensifer]|uniref:cobyrinate a,c-diamide synthase n=1 Tax=unclassified Ensifer TaxID=2633371 RepID=UPI000813AD83|nr:MULTISPECIES: cobyrinate a,c-diamide synthase [unclassified Ensifer]OCO99028.1 cobyrinic acid a,c-diamide synthase [Ensifer sp. LC14]OCP11352.1 cobyrinic acid a,c-diamide synthase [Ensifer sp. LC13]OCP12006.1 cobyrinic acid a,c-diamide synthase [Ensifer sp. LC11]OCP33515.1 cobyrinic acid a,c-diamide synthase [Ensifer sp. LC499]
MSGMLIAAPSSGSGKTTVTLGLMRALRKRGVALAPGKAGPDYIDPAFHAAATGEPCFNFDPWAMRPELLRANASHAAAGGRTLIVEAMMGLHDGAADGTGAPADLAAALNLAVILVVDCARLSHSVAAMVRGYADHRDDIRVVGVVLNKVGSDRHEKMLRDALDRVRMPVFGVLRQDSALALPERHLGLVQAGEHGALEVFIEAAAQRVEAACDLDAIRRAATIFREDPAPAHVERLQPLGQRIAVARDIAFAFSYEHLLFGWRGRGAEISFFSPLADEAPDPAADAIYLPGGYPELHAGRLSTASTFRTSLHSAAERGARIFGECGGYMVLGEGLVAADGARYEMLGLLPLVTSFAERRRHLGYRRVVPVDNAFFDGPMTAHEFHYATIVAEGAADRLFSVSDAAGDDLGHAGLRCGNVAGSFMHLIDLATRS